MSDDRQEKLAGGGKDIGKLTARQLEILQHALGLDRYGQLPASARGVEFRNRFCAGVGDEQDCRELVAMGLMHVFYPNQSPLPYYNCAVTDAGRRAVRDQSPPPPKLTRSQQRYREWLGADLGCSFGEFLKRAGAL